MILVLLAFNHQPPRGYSLSPSSGWSTRPTSVVQPPASDRSSVRSWGHVLPIHTPPSTFEIRSSEYAIHSDTYTSHTPPYRQPQTHPFGAIALRDQSVLSCYVYPLPVRQGTTRPALLLVGSESSIADTSSIPGNVGPASSIGTPRSKRWSFLPALPTMAWGTADQVPLNVGSVPSPPTAAAKEPTLASVPSTRQILPNQAAVAAELPRRESPGFTPLVTALGLGGNGPSTSRATPLPVPPAPLRLPQIPLSNKAISLVLEDDGASKVPGYDTPAMPSSPISIMYGSDILSPSAGLVNVMKRTYSTSTRGKHLSHATRTTTSSMTGAWSMRVSTTESMILNYPFLAVPLSPGVGEFTTSSGTGSGSRQPSTADDASKQSEDRGKRPNTFGKESFLDFRIPAIGSRASSTKTKSSNPSSRSTDGLSRFHSEAEEGPGTRTSKREKGKGSRKARKTPVSIEASNKERRRRSMDPVPPRMDVLEDTTS
jgi:hypothetical protein